MLRLTPSAFCFVGEFKLPSTLWINIIKVFYTHTLFKNMYFSPFHNPNEKKEAGLLLKLWKILESSFHILMLWNRLFLPLFCGSLLIFCYHSLMRQLIISSHKLFCKILRAISSTSIFSK